MSGQHVTWSPQGQGHHATVDDTLDKLLAGLGELSGTLPDLGLTSDTSAAAVPPPAQNNQQVKSAAVRIITADPEPHQADTGFGRQPSADSAGKRLSASRESSILSDAADIMPTRTVPRPASDGSKRAGNSELHRQKVNANGRTYEDDLDYVLEKELDIPIKGQERRPLIGVDNYNAHDERKDGVRIDPQPYHTRYDSKPFSYIRQNPSRSNSRAPSRCSSRDGMDGGRGRGLESPSLLRKVMAGPAEYDSPSPSPVPTRQQSVSPVPAWRDATDNNSAPGQAVKTFVHSQTFQSVHNTENIYSKIGPGTSRSVSLDRGEERPVHISRNQTPERTTFNTADRNRTQSLGRADQYGNRQMITIQTRDKSAYNRSVSGGSSYQNNGISFPQNGSSNFLGVEGSSSGGSSLAGDILDGRSSRTEEERETWLQKQQRKLLQRRNSQQSSSQTAKGSSNVMQELKTSLYRARSGATETTDGYVSDANSLMMSETSRESSPAKQTYHIPVKVESRPSPSFNSSNGSSNQFPGSSSTAGSNSSSAAGNPYNGSSITVNPFSSNSSLTNVSQLNRSNSSAVNHTNTININPTTYPAHQQLHEQLSTAGEQSSIYSSVNKKNAYNGHTGILVSRQNSDTSFDRSRPNIQRKRHESESEAELDIFRNGSHGYQSIPGSRPETPGFPISSTPYFNQSASTLPPKSPGLVGSRGGSRIDLTTRAPSPAGSVYQGELMSGSRRGSVSSEPTEVSANHVKLVKDNHKFWYKKTISRDEAISLLKDQQPGTFIVRDSNSFPGAFGLALKVATPPLNKTEKDPTNELVRHFLIEPTTKGVKLKGYSNEPVFASLSALIYQHTVTALALPIKLVLPQHDLGGSRGENANPEMVQLLQYGAACNVYYLFSQDTDQLTGPQAVRKTVSQLILTRPLPAPTTVHFKVSGQGITLTDQSRKLFFRKHYPVGHITHCGVDPEDRRWNLKAADGQPERAVRLFAFVARKPSSLPCNQCHVFAELDEDQPARAIVNFVNKLMLSGQVHPATRSADMV